jgi:small subunit ribosomal protein S8
MDTVADFLTAIRNAGKAKHDKVDMPSSKIRVGIAEILLKNGFIRSYKVAKDSKQGIMRIYLKYSEQGVHSITELKRASRPGRRYYLKSHAIPEVRSGMGLSILSTNNGIMSGADAKLKNVGGELLCTLW